MSRSTEHEKVIVYLNINSPCFKWCKLKLYDVEGEVRETNVVLGDFPTQPQVTSLWLVKNRGPMKRIISKETKEDQCVMFVGH